MTCCPDRSTNQVIEILRKFEESYTDSYDLPIAIALANRVDHRHILILVVTSLVSHCIGK